MKFLLDTSVCVELVRRRSVKLIRRIAGRPTGDFAVSVIAVAELQYGAEKSARPLHQLQLLQQFLVPLAILEFDYDASLVYGKIRANLETAGTPIGPLDLLIAAQAKSRNLTLVTRNLQEFKRVPGLKAEDWTKG